MEEERTLKESIDSFEGCYWSGMRMMMRMIRREEDEVEDEEEDEDCYAILLVEDYFFLKYINECI